MTKFTDYYKVLGSHRNSSTSELGVKYLMAMREARSKSDTTAMKLIQEAYTVLSSDQKAQYDAVWDSYKDVTVENKVKFTNQEEKVENGLATQTQEIAIDLQNFVDLYYILNVPRKATVDMIQEAYQKLLDLYNEGRLGEEHGQSLVALGTKAVKVLSNPELKTQYDLVWDQAHELATTKTTTNTTWRTTEPVVYQDESNKRVFNRYPKSIVAYINSDILARGNFQKPSENDKDMISLRTLYGVIQDDYTFQFAREKGAIFNSYSLETVPGKFDLTSEYSEDNRPWHKSELVISKGHKMLVIPAIKFITPELMKRGWVVDRISIEDLNKLQNHISRLMLDTPEVFAEAFEDEERKAKNL